MGPKGTVETAIRLLMNGTLECPIALVFSFEGKKTTRNKVTKNKRKFVETIYCKLLEGKKKGNKTKKIIITTFFYYYFNYRRDGEMVCFPY